MLRNSIIQEATIKRKAKPVADNTSLIPNRILPVVNDLARLFKERSLTIYLVGGSVRDIFMGQFQEDLDFTTDARPDQIVDIVKTWSNNLWSVGVKFGTIGLHKGPYKIEITTFRGDMEYAPDGTRQPTFGTSIEHDLARRDFTINAMAIELEKQELIDPFGGQYDLRDRILRTPMEPQLTITDDPLRMLRAIRFSAALDMQISLDMEEAILELRGSLAAVSSERIRDEFSKMITGKNPIKALRMLLNTNLSDLFIPELGNLKITQDPEHHHKDVLEHTLQVVENVEPDLVLRLAALFHDIGKPQTKEIIDGKVTFYNHDAVSAYMTKKRLRALKYSKNIIDDVVNLIYLHMRVYTYRMGWSDKAVRRYIKDAGPLQEKLTMLVRADCTTKNPRKVKQALQVLEELEQRINELEAAEETAKIRAPVNGNEVMEYLGLKPGPLVGEIMRILLDARLDGKIDTKEDAYALVARWADEKGITR